METPDLYGYVTATEFAALTGCSKERVSQWMDPKESKLTEMTDNNPHGSFKKVGYNIMVHIENAKVELRSKLKARLNRNPQLFTFLGMDGQAVEAAFSARSTDEIDMMRPDEVLEELHRVEVRSTEFNLEIKKGEYWLKSVVNFNTGEAGHACKTILEGIAPRYISQIWAASSDEEAENILNKALEYPLEQVYAELNKNMGRTRK